MYQWISSISFTPKYNLNQIPSIPLTYNKSVDPLTLATFIIYIFILKYNFSPTALPFATRGYVQLGFIQRNYKGFVR